MDSRMACGIPSVPRGLEDFLSAWKTSAASGGIQTSPPTPYHQHTPAEVSSGRLHPSSVMLSVPQHHRRQLVQRHHELQHGSSGTALFHQSAMMIPNARLDRDVTINRLSSPSAVKDERGPVALSSNPLLPADVGVAMSTDDVRRALLAAAFDLVNARASAADVIGGNEHLRMVLRHSLQVHHQQQQQRIAAAAVAALSYASSRVPHPVNHRHFEGEDMTSLKTAAAAYYFQQNKNEYSKCYICISLQCRYIKGSYLGLYLNIYFFRRIDSKHKTVKQIYSTFIRQTDSKN